MSMPVTTLEIREFLRQRQAVLVHFSTLMASNPSRIFPGDLQNAITLKSVPLSFSTIQKGDSNPILEGGRGGAEGSIGLLGDLDVNSVVLTVAPDDSGTSYDSGTGQWVSGGKPPDTLTCAESIALRLESNEWFVRGYVPLGIFVFPPLYARKRTVVMGEEYFSDATIPFAEVEAAFPSMRIFSAKQASFLEYDRALRRWCDITYDRIIR